MPITKEAKSRIIEEIKNGVHRALNFLHNNSEIQRIAKTFNCSDLIAASFFYRSGEHSFTFQLAAQALKAFVDGAYKLNINPLPHLRKISKSLKYCKIEVKNINSGKTEIIGNETAAVKIVAQLFSGYDVQVWAEICPAETWKSFLGFIPNSGYTYNDDEIRVYKARDFVVVALDALDRDESFSYLLSLEQFESLKNAYKNWAASPELHRRVTETGEEFFKRFGTAEEFFELFLHKGGEYLLAE